MNEGQGVLLESLEYPTTVCVLAQCYQALPGEDVVGITTKRRVIVGTAGRR